MTEKDRLISRLIEKGEITEQEAALLKESEIVIVKEEDNVFPNDVNPFPPAQFPKNNWINDELQRRADIAKNCGCNPANGGSGICGCTLTGPIITC